MRRLLSTTLGQIFAIVACSTLATFVLFVALIFAQNTAPLHRPWPWPVAHRIISLVNLLEDVPAQHRGRASLLASSQQANLTAVVRDTVPACTGDSLNARVLEAALRAELRKHPGMTVATCPGEMAATEIQVRVPMGPQVLEVRTGNVGLIPVNFNSPVFNALLFMLLSIIALSSWAIWRVVRPLRRLSEKAEAFGREISPAPMAEAGPTEIRNLTRAFNLMQERITRSMQERTRMLAAISHDLRTPLARMRLQLETAQQDADPDKLLKNIELMQTMVNSVLGFLNDGSDGEEPEWLDLDALLATLCDDYQECGADIRYQGPGCIRFRCRHDAIQRALINLIENALHYGQSVHVSASVGSGRILVEVRDDGPGIPSDRLQDVLEPFVSLDSSRNSRPGSVGLGLSIVQEIVRAHGGTLELANGQFGGLTVRIAFPAGAG